MNHTREIPARDWNKYLSGLAEGHPSVRVEVEGGEIGGAQLLVDDLALRRFEFETKGSQKGTIEIEVGSYDEGFSHQITAPEHVWVSESEDGVASSVGIEGGDVKTIIRFD